MPSGWTLLWFGWGLYFLIVEGMALANSTKGDTLSEHVWAFLGIKDSSQTKPERQIYAGLLGETRSRWTMVQVRETTGWTWLRRLAVLGFMASLAIHFVAGSDPLWNAILIGASVVLAATVVCWWVVSRVWK